jgi:hypothetical protein
MIHALSAPRLTVRPHFNRYTEDALDLCDVLPSFALTDRRVPSPMFVAGVIGVERLLRVDFDAKASPIGFVKLALEEVRQRLSQWGSAIPAFGRPTGIVVNFSPDFGVRFDLDGTPQELFHEAYRVGQAHLSIKGQLILQDFYRLLPELLFLADDDWRADGLRPPLRDYFG